MNWIEQIAPTLATCLGGPVAGLAVEAIAKALNVAPEAVQKMVDDGKMSSDQITQLKIAEIEFKQKTQEMGFNFAKLVTDDRISARSMEAATRSNVPALLTLFMVGGFIIILAMKVSGVSMANDPMINDLFTTLRVGGIMILSFYFGSSNGSQKKDMLLYNSMPGTN